MKNSKGLVNYALLIALLVILVVGGYYLFKSGKDADQAPQAPTSGEEQPDQNATNTGNTAPTTTTKPKVTTPTYTSTSKIPAGAAVIHIKSQSFSPSSITVKRGQPVYWINDDVQAHQIMSDPHPTHTLNSALGSNVLSKGQTFNFTFLQVGTYGYHCEVHPAIKGSVTVLDQ